MSFNVTSDLYELVIPSLASISGAYGCIVRKADDTQTPWFTGCEGQEDVASLQSLIDKGRLDLFEACCAEYFTEGSPVYINGQIAHINQDGIAVIDKE